MDPVDLDERLDRELRELPQPRAPHTLLPRVLAATVNRGPQQTASGWFTWPLGWRMTSIAVLIACAASVALLISAPPARVSRAAETAGEIATVVRVVWELMLQPVATYLFVLGISIAFACALAWAALEAALGGASQQ